MIKTIISGVSGQDGSILAEILLEKGHYVIGVDRWLPTGHNPNLVNVVNNPNFKLVTGDIADRFFMSKLIIDSQPDYLYNLGAISLVPESFKIPETVFNTNTMAVLNMLETIRYYSRHTRFYQASTSEQIGDNKNAPQNNDSLMLPNSPYAISKMASYFLVRHYRNAYNLFCVNGMLFNHESERRGKTFVTRKISTGVANIKAGIQEYIELGNLNSKRDWGYCNDFMEGLLLMMETDKPDDYSLATGETHSIREFVEEAFKHVNINIKWVGTGLDEIGVDDNGITRVKVNKEFYRPVEVEVLHGDYSKIHNKLGWKPTTKFKELVKLMVVSDINEITTEVTQMKNKIQKPKVTKPKAKKKKMKTK